MKRIGFALLIMTAAAGAAFASAHSSSDNADDTFIAAKNDSSDSTYELIDTKKDKGADTILEDDRKAKELSKDTDDDSMNLPPNPDAQSDRPVKK